jgi:ATP-dependent Clp protease ATP-binding subunit ClpA
MRNEELSSRHFTTSAIHIVEQLSSRAADRSMSSEATEQTVPLVVFWSILRWERKVGLVALERMAIEVDALARDVDRALSAASSEIRQHAGPPTPHVLPSGHSVVMVDFSARLKPLLAAAEHEALGLGHSWVGTEHLLLAAVRLAGPRLGEILDRHNVTYDAVQQAVLAVLKS